MISSIGDGSVFLCSIVYTTYSDHHFRNLHKTTNTSIYNVNRVPYLDFAQKEVQAHINAKKGENGGRCHCKRK